MSYWGTGYWSNDYFGGDYWSSIDETSLIGAYQGLYLDIYAKLYEF